MLKLHLRKRCGKKGKQDYRTKEARGIIKNSRVRYTVALFSLLLVAANGRVRSVDNPRGNALKYLLLSNELADRSDSKVMLPDKDLFQNFICEYPLDGWMLQRCENGFTAAF